MNELTEEQTAKIVGLRELADFLEQTPELLDMVSFQNMYMFYRGADVQDFARKALLMGNFTKSSDGRYLNVERRFGSINLQLTAPHEDVCEKVVIDSVEVEEEQRDPELVRAALEAIPVVKVTRTVERTEWKCPPSLVEAAR